MARPKSDITLKAIREMNNLCRSCGAPRDRKGPNCTACCEKMSINQSILSKDRRRKGLCPECGAIAVTAGPYSLCMKCWFKKISKDITGSRASWQTLQRTYEQQQGKCVYTGVVLVPGLTASVDHIIPTSRGGTHEEKNLQWVTKQINCMKTDMTHDEFLSMCQLILQRANTPPSGVNVHQ